MHAKVQGVQDHTWHETDGPRSLENPDVHLRAYGLYGSGADLPGQRLKERSR